MVRTEVGKTDLGLGTERVSLKTDHMTTQLTAHVLRTEVGEDRTGQEPKWVGMKGVHSKDPQTKMLLTVILR